MSSSDILDLRRGHPGPEILSRLSPLFAEATASLLAKDPVHCLPFFQYGPNPGRDEFLEALAAFLSKEYGDEVKRNSIFLTAGATNGLWLLLSHFTGQNRLIFVQDPTYYLALDIFRDFKLKVIPVESGLHRSLADDLESKLVSHLTKDENGEEGFSALLYLIPTFHNPQGHCLAKEECQKIVRLTERFNLLTICDDVYNLLYYSELPPKRLLLYDDTRDLPKKQHRGVIVSNGSFSKLLGPGLRLGWIETAPWFIEKISSLGVVESGGALNNYTSGLVTELMTSGLLRNHLLEVREILGRKMSAMADLLDRIQGCQLATRSQGGYFLWLELPEQVSSWDVLNLATQLGVMFGCGDRFSPSGRFKNCIRISVSFIESGRLLDAAEKVLAAIQSKMGVN